MLHKARATLRWSDAQAIAASTKLLSSLLGRPFAERRLIQPTTPIKPRADVLATPTRSQPSPFSPDGATLVSVARDRTARLWDVKSGQSRLVLPHALIAGTGKSWSRPAATASSTSGITRPARSCISSTARAAHRDSYSPDGTQLVANTTGHALLRWDARTYARAEPPVVADPLPAYACGGELRATANSLAFTADGELIASAPAGHDIELWSARTGERKGSSVQGMSFSLSHQPLDGMAQRATLLVAEGDRRRPLESAGAPSPAARGRKATPAAIAPQGQDEADWKATRNASSVVRKPSRIGAR